MTAFEIIFIVFNVVGFLGLIVLGIFRSAPRDDYGL